MQNLSFKETAALLAQRDSRYTTEAYYFIREGLEFTVNNLKRDARAITRHVTGQELCQGLCDYALEEYGPMAYFTLKSWGIKRTEDFGEIVYNLIDAGKLGKSENDKKEDFADQLDLAEVLRKPYEVEPGLDQTT